jgi:Cu(I)/Ag(I) efflux system membrane protein CusA/SilA
VIVDRVIDWSARHPVLVCLAAAAAVGAGWWSAQGIPLDAIPDLGETQVVVYAKWDRSPDIMEDQVTYPIVTAMLGAPRVKDVRGVSDFGASWIYVIFDEGTDLYWARSRTLEYLATAAPRLPPEAKVQLGPDATGVGWVFQYALSDTSGQRNLADLRSVQDWYLRPHLEAVSGVAEVAGLGGFVRQYQVNLDPLRLQAYHISPAKVIAAVRAGNNDAGGRLIDFGGREYMVRGRGYAKTVEDLSKIAVATSSRGVAITVADLGTVVLGPDLRRGAADLNGTGEAVSGIVIMRQGRNALQVIDAVKRKLAELQPGLPPGVKIVTTYDRSELIRGTIANLKSTLVEEVIVVALVILIFLWHFPSAVIPILTIPIAVIVAFIPMRLAGVSANAMSLGGIAIAVGAMVDAAIVVAEQTHKKIERWQESGRREAFRSVVLRGIQEVASPGFFSLLVIAVAFLPIMALEAQEGRLFKPLALTKSFSMLAAAILLITLDPALRLVFTRIQPEIRPEERHPISRLLIHMYLPVVRFTLRWRWAVITGAAALVLLTVPLYWRLGSEFMPPLDEGSLLYMPTTVPGIALPEARRLMQAQDRVLAAFPEVARVTGKAGRADSATDPAPPSMIETVILLKPKDQWPKIRTWYSSWPAWLQVIPRHFAPDHGSTDDLVARMDQALHVPGVSNAWTMPIRNRVEMQATGIRTPVGVKVTGADPGQIEAVGRQVEAVLAGVPGTRSAFAERVSEGYFLDFDLKRDELARFGLTVDDADSLVSSVIGGEDVTTIIDGRARYPVNVRYFPDFRNSIEDLARLRVPVMDGREEASLGDIADIRTHSGPSMLRDENGMLTSYVYADVAGRDVGSYIEEARRAVRERVKLPQGYALAWSGQFEAIERVRQRLQVVVPLTLFLVVMLLYWNMRSWTKTGIVLAAVPFSAVGAVWLLFALGYHMSIAVWVGLIALMGVDAETGVFMLLYLDLALEERRRAGTLRGRADTEEAIVEGAARRIRPKVMTVACMLAGLAPIMWSAGAGSDVMKRIAAPMMGGILTSFLLELAVYPAIYSVWKSSGARGAIPAEAQQVAGSVPAVHA